MIGPRDLLKITVSTGREQEKPQPAMVRVAQNGLVNVPIIGPTKVSGLETHEAGQAIAQTAIERGIYVRPYVTVEMESKAVRTVTVLGAVNEPGVHELPFGNSNLVTALAAAGGLTDDAGTEVEIIRQPVYGLADSDPTFPGEGLTDRGGVELASYQQAAANGQSGVGSQQVQVMRLDLSEQRLRAQTDTRLADRDIVKVIPRAEELIFVSGLVTKPGQYELPMDQDVHLLDAIAMAGGQSSPVADKLLIIRHIDGRPDPVVINASLSAAKRNGHENIRLSPGDTISIEQTPSTVVVDTFTRIFRFSFGLASEAITF